MSNRADDTHDQHVSHSTEEILMNMIHVLRKRLDELELLVKEFISCVENPGAQVLWDEDYVDLVYTYEKACAMLGLIPQEYQDYNDDEMDEETDEEHLIWMGNQGKRE